MRFTRTLAAVAFLGGAGCFSTPGFSGARDGGGSGDDGGSGHDAGVIEPGPVTVGTAPGGGAVVEDPYLALAFDNANWHMPLSLTSKVTGLDELSTGGNGETGLGSSFFNRYSVARGSDPSSVGGHATVEVKESGPVRSIVQVTWDANSPCSGASHIDASSITFNVYPDGRIVRHDNLAMSSSAGCSQIASAYASVVGNRTLYSKFGTVVRPVDAHPNQISEETFENTVEGGWACLEGGGEALGYSWTVPASTPWEYFELGRYPSGNITFGFIYNETKELMTTAYVADTVLAIGQGTCDQLRDRVLEPYASPPAITGADWDPSTGAYLTSVSSVSANADVPAGAVFILENQTEVQEPITIGDMALQRGSDYLVQSAATGVSKGAMLYLKRPILNGQALIMGAN